MLADVVEAFLGAAFLHGGFDLAIEAARFIGMGVKFPWQTISSRVEDILSKIPPHCEDVPIQLQEVERILGYKFKRPLLLVEALTHASHQDSQIATISYERSEFLGDSVLDMIMSQCIHRAPGKNYSPGHIHLRKSAVVNAHFLAYICLRSSVSVESYMPRPDSTQTIHVETDVHHKCLLQYLLHSSSFILDEQKAVLDRYQRWHGDIEEGLFKSKIFPWASLTRLQ